MRRPTLFLCLVLALGGCSILNKDDPPVCNGKHRRPANAHGSVLNGPPPAPSSAAPKLSSASAFFASCA